MFRKKILTFIYRWYARRFPFCDTIFDREFELIASILIYYSNHFVQPNIIRIKQEIAVNWYDMIGFVICWEWKITQNSIDNGIHDCFSLRFQQEISDHQYYFSVELNGNGFHKAGICSNIVVLCVKSKHIGNWTNCIARVKKAHWYYPNVDNKFDCCQIDHICLKFNQNKRKRMCQ